MVTIEDCVEAEELVCPVLVLGMHACFAGACEAGA